MADLQPKIEQATFTTADLAAYTGIDESTWEYHRLHKSGPPSFKVGRRRLYRRDAVDKWLREQEADSQRRDAEKAQR